MQESRDYAILSKIGNALNDPRLTLTVKRTLYTLRKHRKCIYFGPLHSTTSGFQDTRLSKIGKAPNKPRIMLNLKCQRYSIHPLYTHTYIHACMHASRKTCLLQAKFFDTFGYGHTACVRKW